MIADRPRRTSSNKHLVCGFFMATQSNRYVREFKKKVIVECLELDPAFGRESILLPMRDTLLLVPPITSKLGPALVGRQRACVKRDSAG
ncbi:hypothetical protein EVAR_49810_1 [Eumeta japonica]|uniref:Uncharacterized protein n=1 Tax=Eumeta variegata TaxID=151549 RepID=A0A4C1XN39_EUMVA|nr:hypothetical protein EVAR_49810_1 [Eumeta japonica]